MWVVPAVVIALLVVAALADRRARRTGRAERAGPDYWHAVVEERKQVRSRLYRRR